MTKQTRFIPSIFPKILLQTNLRMRYRPGKKALQISSDVIKTKLPSDNKSFKRNFQYLCLVHFVYQYYMDGKFDKERIVNYWIESSDKDFKTMLDLYKTQNNSWALFIGHLVIEKLLKALFVKCNDEFPPLIHDLRRLCEKSNVKLDINRQIMLESITRFNINARYDDYKQSFNSLCTDSFTSEWIEKIEDCRLWIKTML